MEALFLYSDSTPRDRALHLPAIKHFARPPGYEKSRPNRAASLLPCQGSNLETSDPKCFLAASAALRLLSARSCAQAHSLAHRFARLASAGHKAFCPAPPDMKKAARTERLLCCPTRGRTWRLQIQNAFWRHLRRCACSPLGHVHKHTPSRIASRALHLPAIKHFARPPRIYKKSRSIRAASLLPYQGSNLETSDPESDVLPITP